MASNTTQGSALDPDLASHQSLFRMALTQGMVSLEEEIKMRAEFASLLIHKYEVGIQRNPQHLRDAIDHSEAILRRLPRDSPERPKHLTRLSYARTSEYTASRSRRAIDEAVRCGQLAREEAVAAGLPERDLMLYCEILNNVGVALSHRCRNATAVAAQMVTGTKEDSSNVSSGTVYDLDEAIEYGREIKTLVTRESNYYSMTLSNLTSRLMRRYSMRGDPADYAEAVELLQELQSLSPPGSTINQLAILNLGQMAVDKFNKTDTLEDLCAALEQTTKGIDKLSQSYEGKPEGLKQIAGLYSARYKKTNDVADLRNAVHYSNMTLATVPVSHGIRGGYLLDHLRLLRVFAYATTSVQDVEEAVSKGYRHLMEMRNEYPEEHSCRKFYGDVLGRRYILSQRLKDFADAVSHVEKLCNDYNVKVNESGVILPVNASLILSLERIVQTLSLAPPGEARDAATRKLYDQIATACKSPDFVNGLLGIGKEFITLLMVYADASRDGETITDNKARMRAEELQLKEKAELERRLSRPQWKPKDYDTGLGLRQLAMDPTNNRVVLDLRGLMTDIIGYDSSAPMSHSEFVAKQAQVEKESIKKAKAEGRRPNPRLCHMCRLVKPLSPMAAEMDGDAVAAGVLDGSLATCPLAIGTS